jgi:hypothetical protein
MYEGILVPLDSSELAEGARPSPPNKGIPILDNNCEFDIMAFRGTGDVY